MMFTAAQIKRIARPSYAQCGFSSVAGDVVSVFDAYFDESGTHGKRFLVIAGYTAETDKWAIHGLSHFHMTAFMSRSAKAYARLKTVEWLKLLVDLMALLCETAMFGTICIISPHDYESLTTPKYRSQFGSSYAVAGSAAAGYSIFEVQQRCPGVHRVGIFFENGHKNVEQALSMVRHCQKGLQKFDLSGEALMILGRAAPFNSPDDPLRHNTVKIGAIDTGTKEGMPPLQAADIIAYCVYQQLIERNVDFCTAMIDGIDRSVPHYINRFTQENLIEMIKAVTTAEENWKKFRTEAYFLSKETRKEGVRVDADDFGRTMIRSTSDKPLSQEIKSMFYDFLRKQQ